MDRTTLSATSKDANNQKVKKRKNRECTKCAKKTKTIQHSLRLLLVRKLRRSSLKLIPCFRCCNESSLGSNSRKLTSVDSQNKIITAHENCVGALLQEPLGQYLMAGSNQLAIAQCVGFSPNANSDDRIPSEDGIAELKHRSKMVDSRLKFYAKSSQEDKLERRFAEASGMKMAVVCGPDRRSFPRLSPDSIFIQSM
ncbi:hypothetical protein NC651_009761 [Populus alba x Populus x berolinensis]|nr:hypothetical protein NC651_009761 [Populus alba x Populus x berolinensis]